MIPGPEDRGSQQLVSELLDPVAEVRREGSSGHGRSAGGVASEGRRAPVDEDRILSLEDTMRALAGTVIDLNGKLDLISGRFEKCERMLEELTGSRRNPEVPIHNLHHPMAAPCPSPSNQMFNSPLMHIAMTIPEQTHEERIRILTASFQKYKERKVVLQASSNSEYHVQSEESATSIQQIAEIAVPAITSNDVSFEKLKQPEDAVAKMTNNQSVIGHTSWIDVPLYVAGMCLYPESNKVALILLNRELEAWETITVEAVSDDIAAAVVTSCDVMKPKMMTAPQGVPIFWVWDPGIQVRLPSTLRQGRFEGEGIDTILFFLRPAQLPSPTVKLPKQGQLPIFSWKPATSKPSINKRR